MSSGFSVESLTITAEHWGEIGELMSSSQADFARESPGCFAPDVQAAAAAFLTTWAGLAGESSAIATGFAETLRMSQTFYSTTDERAQDRLDNLDGRLGLSR